MLCKLIDKVYLFILLQIASAVIYVSIDNIKMGYSITFVNFCHSEKDRFKFITGTSIAGCVKECGVRSHCMALNFRRKMNLCELFLTSEENQLRSGDCKHIGKGDIRIIQMPCRNVCDYGNVCLGEKQCVIKECTNVTLPTNGTILGNMRDVGSRIQYKCDNGYAERYGTSVAECMKDGNWSATANCVRISCGELPSITNGMAVMDKDNSNLYLDTATVTCEPWYQPNNSVITCTATGDWETAACSDCYTRPAKNFKGKRNLTENGIPCVRWESMSPHIYHDFRYLPDSSVSGASNYCRNPNQYEYEPWCYTSYGHDWGYCGIEKCV